MASDAIIPFRVSIPQEEIDDLRQRLTRARWPEKEPVGDWSQGVPLARLKALVDHWRDHYDWRRCEAALNANPNYKTEIDGLDIHFIHRRSSRADAIPILMTHGWPGSVVEVLGVIEALAEPEDPGVPAFHVIAPSLPGYGFSGRPAETGWNHEHIARAWAELMRRLGYESWVAQGGDWGAVVTITLATHAPRGLKGVHLNMAVIYPPADMETPTPEEQKVIDDLKWHVKWDSAYQRVQGTRPQTLGYSLSDSPVGQAAWIYEKCYAWTDNDGEPEQALSMDQMLDNISLYWFTNTGGSSARLYWELGDGFTPGQVDLPVGVSLFPREILRPSRRWVDRYWSHVAYWKAVDRGGHFAAWEEPDLFVAEMRACFGLEAFR